MLLWLALWALIVVWVLVWIFAARLLFWVCFGMWFGLLYLVNSVAMISSLFVGNGAIMLVGCAYVSCWWV